MPKQHPWQHTEEQILTELETMGADTSPVVGALWSKFEAKLRNLSLRAFAVVEQKAEGADHAANVWRAVVECWSSASKKGFHALLLTMIGACGEFKAGVDAAALISQPGAEAEMLSMWHVCSSVFVDMTSTVLYKQARESKLEVDYGVHAPAELLGHLSKGAMQLLVFSAMLPLPEPEDGGMHDLAHELVGGVGWGGVGRWRWWWWWGV